MCLVFRLCSASPRFLGAGAALREALADGPWLAALFRAWRSASDGRAAGIRYAAWLDAFAEAGFGPRELGGVAARPEDHPERPGMEQLAAMASLLALGQP
jgi:hypothetical protein